MPETHTAEECYAEMETLALSLARVVKASIKENRHLCFTSFSGAIGSVIATSLEKATPEIRQSVRAEIADVTDSLLRDMDNGNANAIPISKGLHS